MSDFPNGYLTTGNKPVINDAYKASEEYLKEQQRQDNLYNDEGDIYESAINNAFMAGAKWQKEQMRKDAIVATVISLPNDWGEYMPIIEISVDRDYQEGSKVKVLIIKEE